MIPLRAGAMAPDFIAVDQDGNKFTLSQWMCGACVLLIFYPSDWGFICRNEIVEFRDRQADYESLGIKLLGISTNMVISHGLWSEQLRLSFPLISDPPGDVPAAYGVLDTDEESFNKGRAKRALFLMDWSLTIRYAWVADNPWFEPDYEDVFSECRAILKPSCSTVSSDSVHLRV